jgi:hypothetical protein
MRTLVELEWTDRIPYSKDLSQLNEILFEIDYDAPVLTENGVYGVWRHPLVPISVVAGVLHAMGWPCRFRLISDVYKVQTEWWETDAEAERRTIDAVGWVYSAPEAVRAVDPGKVFLLKHKSRSIDKLLPPEPKPRTYGRRGPKRFRKRLWCTNEYK